MRHYAVSVLSLALGGIWLASLWAESPAFEVASIRVHPGTSPMRVQVQLRHGRLRGENVTLSHVLSVAFGVSEDRIIGPNWLERDRFDFAGKSPEGIPDSEMKPMRQALLRDRFRLKEHTELRKIRAYTMVVAPGGVKMPVYPSPEPTGRSYPHGYPMMRGTLTTAQIAELISPIVGRPVVDATGLTERYNLLLSFAPFTPRTEVSDDAGLGPPDIFTAMQEQLGLRLNVEARDLNVIVVDSIERMPSAN